MVRVPKDRPITPPVTSAPPPSSSPPSSGVPSPSREPASAARPIARGRASSDLSSSAAQTSQKIMPLFSMLKSGFYFMTFRFGKARESFNDAREGYIRNFLSFIQFLKSPFTKHKEDESDFSHRSETEIPVSVTKPWEAVPPGADPWANVVLTGDTTNPRYVNPAPPVGYSRQAESVESDSDTEIAVHGPAPLVRAEPVRASEPVVRVEPVISARTSEPVIPVRSEPVIPARTSEPVIPARTSEPSEKPHIGVLEGEPTFSPYVKPERYVEVPSVEDPKVEEPIERKNSIPDVLAAPVVADDASDIPAAPLPPSNIHNIQMGDVSLVFEGDLDNEGKPTGFGKLFQNTPEGERVIEGNFVRGLPDGMVEMRMGDRVLKQEFEHGKPKVIENLKTGSDNQYEFDGYLKEGQPYTGRGSFATENGHFEGEIEEEAFKNGRQTIVGEDAVAIITYLDFARSEVVQLTFNNGGNFVGTVDEEGKPFKGQGVLYDSLTKFEGEVEEGKPFQGVISGVIPTGSLKIAVTQGQRGRGTLTYIHPYGQGKFNGIFTDDFKPLTGVGTRIDEATGNRWTGEWQNGLFIGKEVVIEFANGSKYEGGIQKGYYHGKGKLTDANGFTFEATRKEGLIDSDETVTTPSGEKLVFPYDLSTQERSRAAKLIYVDVDGVEKTTYARFNDDFTLNDGTGIYRNANIVFYGYIKDSLPVQGTMIQTLEHRNDSGGTLIETIRYEGGFNNNLLQGKGKLTSSLLGSFEGTFQDGIIQDEGTLTIPNGVVFTGTFDNNRPLTGVFKLGEVEVRITNGQRDDGRPYDLKELYQ